jgi:hypothetical protein
MLSLKIDAPDRPCHGGFVALVAVLLIASGALAFSLMTASSAIVYADSVVQRELRIQAGLDASACLDTAILMVSKDFFLNGTADISEFGCTAEIANPDAAGAVSISVASDVSGVKAYADETIYLHDDFISF